LDLGSQARVARFFTASVAKACGEHDQDEREPIGASGQGGQDEDQREAQGREDAVEQT
jgi:hypothetical protein